MSMEPPQPSSLPDTPSTPQIERQSRSAGFMLSEVLVAIAVFALIGLSIFRILINTGRSHRAGSTIAEAKQNAQAGLDLILRDIRAAGDGIKSADKLPIEIASEYRVTFVIDADADGTIEDGERITYFLDPNASDPLAAETMNPSDFVLRKLVNAGADSMAVPGTGKGEVVACGVTQRTRENTGWNVRLFDYLGADGNSLIGVDNDPDGAVYGHTVSSSLHPLLVAGSGRNMVRAVRVELVTEAGHRHPETHTYPQVRLTGTIHPRNLAAAFVTRDIGTATDTETGTPATRTTLPRPQPPIHIPTERVHSLTLAELNERDSLEGSQVTQDNQHDWDIVVTTQTSGTNNLLVWFQAYPDLYRGNRWYPSAANYLGRSTRSIHSVAAGNVDPSNEFTDIVAAIGVSDVAGGFEVWPNQGNANRGRVGIGSPVTTPHAYYSQSTGAGRSISLADFDRDGDLDVALGTRTGDNAGVIEIWLNDGWGTYTRSRQLTAAGEVNALVTADFNADNYLDIAAGTKTHTNDKNGKLEVWLNDQSNNFARRGPWDASGKVNAIAAGAMNAGTSIDIVAGTKTGNSSGKVELFLNDGTGNMASSDHAIADDNVLSIAVGKIDLDDNLDVVCGTDGGSVLAWFCDPDAAQVTAIIPANTSWGDANTGGSVNAVSLRQIEAPADNPALDQLSDIVCGTAISATSGEIVLYLNPFVCTHNP